MIFIETALFLLFALPSSFLDIRKLKIPVIYVIVGVIVFFLYRIFSFYFYFGNIKVNLLNTFIAIFSSTILLFITRIFSAGGLGKGDILFGILTALYCNFYVNLIALSFSAISGILFYLLLAVIEKRFNEKNPNKRIYRPVFAIPFVPFMTFGSLLAKFLF